MNSIYSLLGIVVYGAIFAMVMCHVIRRQVEERELERQEERNNAVSDLKADEEIYPRLTHVRVLEEFEGPILSKLRGDDGQPWSLEGDVFEADEPIDDLDDRVQAIVDEHESEMGYTLDAYGELEWELPDFQLEMESPEFEAGAMAFVERVERLFERLGMRRL